MLRLLIGVPTVIVLIIFALSNRGPVSVGFIGYSLVAPLSVAILVCAAFFFLCGAILVWFGELAQRRRARRAERRVRELEAEVTLLQARPVLHPGVAEPVGTALVPTS